VPIGASTNAAINTSPRTSSRRTTLGARIGREPLDPELFTTLRTYRRLLRVHRRRSARPSRLSHIEAVPVYRLIGQFLRPKARKGC
jgi:hypothetical protein